MMEWDGIPENSDQEGLHYVGDAVAFWRNGKWAVFGQTELVGPEWLASQWWATYRGPCPDHPDVAANIEAERRARTKETP